MKEMVEELEKILELNDREQLREYLDNLNISEVEALIDEMAAGAWEMAGYGGKWADVHATWSVSFRHHAELMLRVLERDHDHG